MTEDQKAASLILEILHASKAVPRTYAWIESEVKRAGYRFEVATMLEILREGKLVAREKDGLGIYRYTITPAGKEALELL
jgi:hypothetical protein